MFHTIAIDTVSGLLLACVKDGADIDAEIDRVTAEAGVNDIERSLVEVYKGVTLTDDADAGEIVYRGSAMGYLADETGKTYRYAVDMVDA